MYTIIDSNLNSKVSFRDNQIATLREDAARLNKTVTELNRTIRKQTQEIMVLEYKLARVSKHVRNAYKAIKKEAGK